MNSQNIRSIGIPYFRFLRKCLISSFLFLVLVSIIDNASAENLEKLLPSTADFKTLQVVDVPQRAEGNELYKLINGGAVLYYQNNFKKAIFQEYQVPSGGFVTLEIYQMASPKNAQVIFNKKRGEESSTLDTGEQGVLADYYCIFRRGSFFITITGDPSAGTRETLLKIARLVDGKIKAQNDIE